MRATDVLIVGGGPAGSSCAGQLLAYGCDCLLLERKRMPRSKLCAGWITPKVLHELAIRPDDYPHGIVRLDRIKTFFGRRHRWSRVTKTEQYSIRRVEFDAWLLERSGVEVVEHTVHAIVKDGPWYVIDGQYRSRYLVGAGGTNCPVKRTFFPGERGQRLVTQEVEYDTVPPNPVCTLWFPYAGSRGYAWYVPKANAVNIGFGGLRRQLTDWHRQDLWRDFLQLLQGEGCLRDQPPEPKGYSYYVGGQSLPVRNERAYVVGDAAGLATLDLAEGIGPAVESGVLAAQEILGIAGYATQAITRHSLSAVSRFLKRAVCTVT